MSSCHVWKFEHAYIKQLTPQDPATREKRNQVDPHIAAIAQAIQARLAQNNTPGTVCVSDANHIVAEPGHDLYAVGGSKWRTEIRIPVGAAEDSTALEYALSCLLEQESMTLSTNESESHPAKVVAIGRSELRSILISRFSSRVRVKRSPWPTGPGNLTSTALSATRCRRREPALASAMTGAPTHGSHTTCNALAGGLSTDREQPERTPDAPPPCLDALLRPGNPPISLQLKTANECPTNRYGLRTFNCSGHPRLNLKAARGHESIRPIRMIAVERAMALF